MRWSWEANMTSNSFYNSITAPGRKISDMNHSY